MLQDSSHAFAYADDSEEQLVIDNPDDPLAVEVVVHVHNTDDGLWHKLTPNHLRTSCGKQFDSARSVVRREELANAHTLCTVCFTAYERLLAADADANRRRDTLESAPLNLRDFLDEQPRNSTHNPKRRK